ncbi:NADH-quinone oxidoreductase subunit M [Nocardioides sp.]|uniref:NADH-quinone oxidoreductase subunit M n=1 Tax=Nocardioides sp. TaxID=35761 RepID=UPI00271C786B|nr:NADH-quinone oxidoreductase subunit M [Nocardioides sp.]MDO9457777.1 NADH-quinone oxidoreductase subunit M [Nocardioides sp.]
MLTVLILVPLVGALVIPFLPAATARSIAIGVSAGTLGLGVAAATMYDVGSGMQLEEKVSWIESFGVHYALGVDGLGILMVLLTVVITPVVMLAGWHEGEEAPRSYYAWMLALEALSLAVFCATDVFLFYVVFEATLIPAYFLVGGFGKEGRGAAASKFLMFQLAGGLVLLASVIGLYVVSSQQGEPSYLLEDLQDLDISTGAGRWLFVGFFVAFAIKAPLFPVHTWLADTTEKATPGVSVMLVCVLDKIGTFGMLRFCLGIFPEASQWATPVVVTLAVISIIYGALVAIAQDDVLRLIGLTSLSHFGFITLGIFVFSTQGSSGAILYMVNHGIGTAALFLVAGYLISRRGTTLISEMGGLEKATPVLAGLMLVAGLATLGLPGLSPFVSEFLVLLAAFDYAWWVGAFAVTGIVLAAIYVLWMYQRIFTGPGHEIAGAADGHGHAGHDGAGASSGSTATAVRSKVETIPDATPREILAVAPLMVALVLFGFFPQPLLDVSNPYAEQLLQQQVGVQDDAPEVPPADDAETGE